MHRSSSRPILAVLVILCVSPVRADDAASSSRFRDERMAAWHETIVSADEVRPNSCVSTYTRDRFGCMLTYGLVKLMCGVEDGGKVLWPEDAQSIKVEDFPGGVAATYSLGRVKVRTEIIPLMAGRGTKEHEGAAVYRVTTQPAVPVVVRFSGGSANDGTASQP